VPFRRPQRVVGTGDLKAKDRLGARGLTGTRMATNGTRSRF